MDPNLPAPKASVSDFLAAERTLLAWIRTGLAMMGFGFVVARFGLFLREFQAAEHVEPQQATGFSQWVGIAMIVVGVIVNVWAGWHHARIVAELNRGETTRARSSGAAVLVAFFLAIVGLAMAIYLVLVHSSL